MTDSKKPSPGYSRAPAGVLTAKPVALRLMAEERATLEKIALEQDRSMASQARIFFLRGLSEHLGSHSARTSQRPSV
ncbi:hypothetical protein [Marinobacter sp. X15-166B]|uniref:hypothetical protein n=1 Tax=Marinobacter sp. X15-166B TaxID=1897620 RepID=UPI00085C554D|nr:hypothetical protein [Marinobacter sp. X15-166B]OEY67446.1 hypothetical protein BG841_14065 [Marinobacter sp. X15-166B]